MRAQLSLADLKHAVHLVSSAATGLRADESLVASLKPCDGGLVIACQADLAVVQTWLPCHHTEDHDQLSIGVELLPLALALEGGADGAEIRTLPSENVLELSVSSGRKTRMRLHAASALVEPPEGACWHDVPLAVLTDLLKSTRLVSTEKFRPEFTQWALKFEAGSIRSECGNGGLFEVRAWDGQSATDVPPIAILQQSCIKPMVALIDRLRRKEPTAMVKVTDDGQRFFVQVGDTLGCFGGDGRLPYPDARALTKRASPFRCVLFAADLRTAIRRIEVGEDFKASKKIHGSHATWMRLGDVNLVWEGERFDEVTLIPALAASGPSGSAWPRIKLLTSSLIDICKTAKSFEYLQIEAFNDAAPLVIRMSSEPALLGEARMRHKAGGYLTVSIIAGHLKKTASDAVRSDAAASEVGGER